MKKPIVFLALFGLLITGLSTVACKSDGDSGTTQRIPEVDKLFSQWDKYDSPGAAIAVLKEGKIIFKNGYGESQLEYNIPITPSTIFHVASVSKQFTAFSIIMLADQGKLSLDDDIRQYIPEAPDFAETITIRHLIHHTSGLRDQWELLAMAGWRLDDVITKEHILTAFRNQEELNFKPGDEYLYCNTGYTLLAEIVARVTGQPFPEWTQENLFQPLGMTSTHFHDNHRMIVKNRAYSYAPSETGGFEKRVLSYANVGATSLFTTVEDLSRWANNFFTKKVGGPKVIAQMEEQGILNSGEKIDYASGVGIGKYRDLKTISHSGGDAGFRSHLLLFPDQKLAVAVLSNCGNINTGRLARQTSEVFLRDIMEEEPAESKTSERKVAAIPSSVLEVYEGKYELEDGNTMIITKEGDRLMAEHPAAPEKIQLFPEARAKFFIKEADVQVHFHPEKDGYVERLTLFMEGKELKGKRIKIKELTPEQMQEYTGDFYSRELGTSYKLLFEENNLLARHRRHGDIPLILKKKDQFTGRTWFFQKVRFMRNEKQEISGFLLTGGRVRNLRFIKQQ
jgi:CubicO group peptidase (beta-lactamase class C family)